MTEPQDFFMELERCYRMEKQDFVWDWEGVEQASRSSNLPPGTDMLSDYICFIAYNLAKNVLHGELPDSLHNRMMFQKSDWAKKYVEFLEK